MFHWQLQSIVVFGLLVESWSYTALGSSPPERCDSRLYECPSHYQCIVTDREASGSRYIGTCVCDNFYGFEGADCRGRSAAWYLLFSLCSVVVLFVLYALYAHVKLMRELQTSGRLKANVIGRTLLFNGLSLLPVIAINGGMLMVLLEVDRSMIFHQYARALLIALLFVLFIVSWLSVSIYWLETAERMTIKNSHHVPIAVLNSHMHNTVNSRVSARYRMYRAILYGASLTSGASVVIFMFVLSTFFVLLCGVIFSLAVGFTYYIAGGRIAKLLDVTSSGMGGRQEDLARYIRVTATVMARYTTLMAFFFAAMGFTVPTNTQLYPGQRNLPAVFSGQIPFFLANMCALVINLHFVEYLRFDPKRSPSLYSAGTWAVLFWRCCRNDDTDRLSLPSHYHPHAVAPDAPSSGGNQTGISLVTPQQLPNAPNGLLLIPGEPSGPALHSQSPPRNTSAKPTKSASSSSAPTSTNIFGTSWWWRPKSMEVAAALSWWPPVESESGREDGNEPGSNVLEDNSEQGIISHDGWGAANENSEGWPSFSGRRSDMYSESDIMRSDTGMDSSNLESVREVYMIGPQMHYNNRGNGGGSSSSSSHGSGGSVGSRPSSCPSQGPVVRIPVASGVVGGSPGEAWRGERGAPPHMPLVLVTVDSKSRRVSARAVVNCGNGHVIDLDDEKMPDLATADTHGTAFCALSAGSHAFVRCYGERCLRCTWLSFPFGFAGGHPLLANNHMVLMAGEIEVDSAGNLTRWLNKSGLYMPPRWAVGQAGLPFDTAWLFVTDNEVSAMAPERRSRLIEEGSLLKLDFSAPALEARQQLADTSAEEKGGVATTSVSGAIVGNGAAPESNVGKASIEPGQLVTVDEQGSVKSSNSMDDATPPSGMHPFSTSRVASMGECTLDASAGDPMASGANSFDSCSPATSAPSAAGEASETTIPLSSTESTAEAKTSLSSTESTAETKAMLSSNEKAAQSTAPLTGIGNVAEERTPSSRTTDAAILTAFTNSRESSAEKASPLNIITNAAQSTASLNSNEKAVTDATPLNSTKDVPEPANSLKSTEGEAEVASPSMDALPEAMPPPPAWTSVHAQDTWVMRVDSEAVWQYSVSQTAFMAARSAILAYRQLKRRVRKRMLRRRNAAARIRPIVNRQSHAGLHHHAAAAENGSVGSDGRDRNHGVRGVHGSVGGGGGGLSGGLVLGSGSACAGRGQAIVTRDRHSNSQNYNSNVANQGFVDMSVNLLHAIPNTMPPLKHNPSTQLPPIVRPGSDALVDQALGTPRAQNDYGVRNTGSPTGWSSNSGFRASGRSGANRNSLGSSSVDRGSRASQPIPEGTSEEGTDERGYDELTYRSDDDDHTFAKEERAALRSMKEEMRRAGTLRVYQDGAAERRQLKAGLGFSKQLQLDGQLPTTAADADLDP